ncbi:MAG: ATP-dependent DNA helicase RecG [Pseudomonadota bacterium]
MSSGRPEALFGLFAELESLTGVGPKTARLLGHMDVTTPKDLLFVLPSHVIDRRLRETIKGQPIPGVCTVPVTIGDHWPTRRKGGPYTVRVSDAEEPFEVIFFHARAPYLQRLLPTGQQRILSGKFELFDGRAQLVHPDYVLGLDEANELPSFEPIYPLTAGVNQKQMGKAVAAAVARAPDMPEWIDAELVRKEAFPDWKTALAQAHNPKSDQDLIPSAPARKRLAYDEVLAHQMTLALARMAYKARPGRVSKGSGERQSQLLDALPYEPTGAQTRAVSEILGDMASTQRMNRLLQGDVGSGKTLVAALAMVNAVEAGGQAVLMAPTGILAHQHMEGLAPLMELAGIRAELLTGRDKGQGRAQKLADLASGEIQVLIGTHAVFQEDVTFFDLRLAVIDEQHRFGVRQRLALGQKGSHVDVLVMTATPIPRTLSMAQYGDLDVSVLDEKPPGRQPIKTAMVSDKRLDEVVAHLKDAIADGKQAYWVCPLVDESEHVDMTAAEARFKKLRAKLGASRVALVHGQMPPQEKDAAMASFVSGERSVLVATTVIEVGVNVPKATIMVIEQAESFGLAQLHQLRGRVGRGSEASTCLLLYTAPLTPTGGRRLQILRDSEDGFRIAEEDLAIRGAGDMIGAAQSGLPRFRIADLERDTGLMALAQSDARTLLTQDPELQSERGKAMRQLLWLMEQDKAIGLVSVG